MFSCIITNKWSRYNSIKAIAAAASQHIAGKKRPLEATLDSSAAAAAAAASFAASQPGVATIDPIVLMVLCYSGFGFSFFFLVSCSEIDCRNWFIIFSLLDHFACAISCFVKLSSESAAAA